MRELFAYLRTVVPPVMEDGQRRIRERVDDERIQVHPETVKSLAGRRLGRVSVVPIVHLWARTGEDRVSVAIGIQWSISITGVESPVHSDQLWRS